MEHLKLAWERLVRGAGVRVLLHAFVQDVAVRALGRIGDTSAVPALLEAWENRDSLSAFTQSAEPDSAISSPHWDRRWQIDLALARERLAEKQAESKSEPDERT